MSRPLYRVVEKRGDYELRVWAEGRRHEWWSIWHPKGLGHVGSRAYIARLWREVR
jgi:hypothetical protein